MKTKNTLILMAGVALLALSFTRNTKNDLDGTLSAADTSCYSETLFVPYFSGLHEIYYYTLWREALPRFFSWDYNSGIIKFQSVQVTNPKHKNSIDSLLAIYCQVMHKEKDTLIGGQLCCTGNSGTCQFPFIATSPNQLAGSYFIPKENLDTLFSSVREKHPNCNGYRVSIAIGDTTPTKFGDEFTHLLINAAYMDESNCGIGTDYFLCKNDGGPSCDTANAYYLDLTTPCPRACPSDTVFVNP